MVFISYVRVFKAGFIWDDEAHLTQNPCIVGPLGLKEVWTSAHAVYYPLVLTTFWILHKFVGLSPWPYHLLNVLLHAGSALLLWRILQQLNVRGAWLGAALWALHPVMVESVAWITELKNTQSCLFYLLSIFCFLKWEGGLTADYADEADRSEPTLANGSAKSPFRRFAVSPFRTWRWFALSLVFFILATLSKPSVVMLPFILALCVWWRRSRIRWRDVAAVLPFVLLSALASAWTILEQKFHAGAIGTEWAQTWPERFIIAGRAIWFYLAKLIWPHPLIFIYPRWEIDSSQLIAYLPLLAAAAGLIALWLIRAKWSRAIFFAAAYFVISLFPVLGFFNVFFFRYSFVSDHFQYLASIGPLALAGAAVAIFVGRVYQTPHELASDKDAPQFWSNSGIIRARFLLGSAFCGILLLSLAFLTWRQTAVYRDLVTLYTTTLARNPGCWMAHYNLGIALNDQGDTDGAIAHYRQAVELRPGYAEAHYNLGRLLAQKGRLDDAVTHYERVLETNPADAEAHNNLGTTLFGSGRISEAIAQYRSALAIQPDYADASCNLASALLSTGDLDGAITHYSECLARSPNQSEAQYNLASALLRRGRTAEAIVHYQKVLELRPDNPDAHANLGSAFLAKGLVRDAIAQYRDALRIAPGNVAARSNLAWLLATAADPSLRDGSEAILLAERAESESSGNENRPLVLRILAAAYAEAGRFTEARKAAQQALEAAKAQGNSALSNALRDEIALYELGLPYHKESK
ncbi:MAG: tetratricopeptide repeat protein [Verrucomicrobia bacterium]|nr:tetratricopeptide repeat protein [Verrucomicrobiota bacterium]